MFQSGTEVQNELVAIFFFSFIFSTKFYRTQQQSIDFNGDIKILHRFFFGSGQNFVFGFFFNPMVGGWHQSVEVKPVGLLGGVSMF